MKNIFWTWKKFHVILFQLCPEQDGGGIEKVESFLSYSLSPSGWATGETIRGAIGQVVFF